MFEAETDSQEEEEGLLVKGPLQIDATDQFSLRKTEPRPH